MKEKLFGLRKKLVLMLSLSLCVFASCVTSYAADGSAVTSALTTGITGIANDAMTTIASVIPVALPIMGALVVVGIGLKIFRKVTGR